MGWYYVEVNWLRVIIRTHLNYQDQCLRRIDPFYRLGLVTFPYVSIDHQYVCPKVPNLVMEVAILHELYASQKLYIYEDENCNSYARYWESFSWAFPPVINMGVRQIFACYLLPSMRFQALLYVWATIYSLELVS